MQASELLQRIRSNRAPVIMDTRTGLEYKRGHVPGAIHIPAHKILLKSPCLPKDKELEIVIYCGHGPRAMIARRLLALRGYRNMDLITGHWKFWRNAGLPVEK